jgi:hypothetical protein
MISKPTKTAKMKTVKLTTKTSARFQSDFSGVETAPLKLGTDSVSAAAGAQEDTKTRYKKASTNAWR